MDYSSDNYLYSFIANEDFWITYTLEDYEYNKLSLIDKRKCVHLPTLADEVYRALNLPNVSKLLLSSCQRLDAEDWADVSEGTSNNKITATIDGVIYTVDESYPYFCFVGANIIGQLWRSRNPLLFDVSYKNFRMDKIVPEQLRNLYGVFEFSLTHDLEGHGFVLYMTEKSITLYNSYGGNVGFYVTNFDRNSWLNLFIGFWDLPFTTQMQYYHMIWGFPDHIVSFLWTRDRIRKNEKIKFRELQYAKIY